MNLDRWFGELRDEVPGDGADGGGGAGEALNEGALGDDVSTGEAPAAFLKDWTEDDLYSRVQQIDEYPDRLNALESRLFGSQGPIKEQLKNLSEAMGKRVEVNTEALKALDEYDPKLREALESILPDLLNVTPIDETVLEPYLSPVRDGLGKQFGQELVEAFYSAEDVDAIVPKLDGNKNWAPQGQRQEDFVNWYSKQGYDTIQALQKLGAPYVRALQRFERWEQEQVKEREKAAESKVTRLKGGEQPAGKGKRSTDSGLSTEADGFYSRFKKSG